jgi:DNA ligase-1
MGGWSPTPDFYHRLLSPDTADADKSRPYPFCLAHPIDSPPRELGDLSEWQVEWKWDGIRAQLIRRGGRVFIWSRGEDLVTDRFPEVRDSALLLQDGIVLDGELLAWSGGRVLPFSLLQRRIGRKTLSRSMLRDVPVAFLSFDLLEVDDRDIRDRPLFERRAVLETVLGKCIPGQSIHPAPLVQAPVWEELAALREESRERLVEGFMLKRLDSPYSVGRKRGVWWKWKVDPFTIDAVLIYAQRGHGKRATLYTDYTFAIRDGDDLVPFAKAYSGLTDEEIRTVDRFIRQNTVERFGPVRSVRPFLVFEIGFEGIRKSSRHRSGVAVRFPRILRWRQDKKPEDADSLDTLNALISRDG